MSCCGLTAEQAQAAALRVIDERVGAQTHVKLVYVGSDKLTRAYVVGGNVYQFGNNERRRVNTVSARWLSAFLDPTGRYYGKFELFDAAIHNADGTAVALLQLMPDAGLVVPKSKKHVLSKVEGKE